MMKKAGIKAVRSTSTVSPLFLALLLLSIASDGHAVTTMATGSGNWGDAIWDSGVPAAGYDVVIPGGYTVTNNAPTADLASLTNNGTLVFSGWNSGLTATVVTVNGTITHPLNTDITGNITNYSDWTPDNRVLIACSNLTVSASGMIDLNSKGYQGRKTGFQQSGYGPGGGPYTVSSSAQGAGGGGSGGQGRDGEGGIAYGSLTAPVDPGSGGGSGYNGYGGHGGGAIQVSATGEVAINGTVRANGEDAGSDHSGGGSGGSIYITCRTFAGAGGTLSANGGTFVGTPVGSGGGGGRISLIYDPTAQSNAAMPTVIFQVKGGHGSAYKAGALPGQAGTVYLLDNQLLVPSLTSYFKNLRFLGFSSWRPQSLTITNADVAFEETNFVLTVTNNISISGAGASLLISTNALVNCLNLTLADAGVLYLYSGMTDGVSTTYGALLSVTNDLNVSNTGSWIYVFSHPTNGGSCLLRMNNLYINSMTTNHGINAVGGGFRGGRGVGNVGYGPGTTTVGANNTSGGAGYGGVGGDSMRLAGTLSGAGGPAYGSPYAPVDPGSGAGSGYQFYTGGDGGGLIRILATGNVLVNGTLDASGTYANQHAGGGSGGGIYITCNTIAGTGGVIRANGGYSGPAGDGGAGGGGRIAIVYSPAAQSNQSIPSIQFQASPGLDWGQVMSYGLIRITRADLGTLYLPDRTFLTNTLLTANFQNVRLYGWTSWSAPSLTLNNAAVRFDESGFLLTITNNILITGTGSGLGLTNNATLSCGSLTLSNGASYYALNVNCAGNLIVGTGCQFMAYAFVTNAVGTNYGALVDVAGSISVASNAWIVPISHPTNGASTLFRSAQWLTITGGTNGGFNARGRGFWGGRAYSNALAAGMGPGGGGAVVGGSGSGGGYGGSGGRSRNVVAGGITYGSSNAPVQPGSGGGRCGGNYHGGDGGGLVRIEARRVILDGTIDARGTDVNYDHDGGGAGGGIYIICATIAGNGSLRADGGGFTGVNGGNGGGGRIAVRNWTGYNAFTGTASVTTNFTITPGYSPLPDPGTIVWAEYSSPGTVFVIH